MSYQQSQSGNQDTTGRRERFSEPQRGVESSGAYDPRGYGSGGRSTGARDPSSLSEDPAFAGSDTAYTGTDTGATFGSHEPGFGQSQGQGQGQFDSSAGLGPGDRSRPTGNLDDQTESTYREGQQGRSDRDDAVGGESRHEREGGKPTFGDKMRGTAEKLAGSVSGSTGMKARGEERKTGEYTKKPDDF